MNGQKRKELKSYKRTSFYPLSVVKLTEKHLIQNWLFYRLSGERTHPPLETLLKHGASPCIFLFKQKWPFWVQMRNLICKTRTMAVNLRKASMWAPRTLLKTAQMFAADVLTRYMGAQEYSRRNLNNERIRKITQR